MFRRVEAWAVYRRWSIRRMPNAPPRRLCGELSGLRSAFHYTERPDLPRTLYSAFGTYPGTLEEAMRSSSSVHLVSQMPASAAYYIFHCDEDRAVNKQKHSDRFVEKMLAGH